VTRRTRIAHALVVLVGLLILAYPLTFGAASETTCRGVVMRPGQSCAKSDGSGVQTYEQRTADRRHATPVIIGVGALVTAFGTSLLVTEIRRSRREPTAT
jgi:hypothetical protein